MNIIRVVLAVIAMSLLVAFWHVRDNEPRGYVCQMEPSSTIEGWEIIGYPSSVTVDAHGFRVPCPKESK